ncbi:MAG: hypothetical protein K0Q51_124 [Rickettsiaceae bacterium]|jgi:hypothetical protein|nr:hypothetical protein [Rickettsiaceae bacterium]
MKIKNNINNAGNTLTTNNFIKLNTYMDNMDKILHNYHHKFTSALNNYYDRCSNGEIKYSKLHDVLEFGGTVPVPFNPLTSAAYLEGKLEGRVKHVYAQQFLKLAENSEDFHKLTDMVADQLVKAYGNYISFIHTYPKELEKSYHGLDKIKLKIKEKATHVENKVLRIPDEVQVEDLLAVKHAKALIHAAKHGRIDKDHIVESMLSTIFSEDGYSPTLLDEHNSKYHSTTIESSETTALLGIHFDHLHASVFPEH